MAMGTKLGYADGATTAGLKFAGTGAKSGEKADFSTSEIAVTYDSTLIDTGNLGSTTTIAPSFIRVRMDNAWWYSEIATGTAASSTTSRIPVDADVWEDIPFPAHGGSFYVRSSAGSTTGYYKIYFNGV